MLAAAGVLIGLGVLAIVGVGVKVASNRETAAQQQQHEVARQRELEQTFAQTQREIGINDNLGDLGENALAGLSAGAAFGAAAGPLGAALGAFVGAAAGLVKAAVDTEAYGTIVRESLKTWLQRGDQPASSAHIDAILYRDGLLGADHVWYNPRTGEVAVEVLELAHGRREHFHNLPYPPHLSLGAKEPRRNQKIPGRASWTVREMIAGTNTERLDGPGQRAARREWWDQMQVGDLYKIRFITGKRSWNPQGSYLSGPGFRALWPYLSDARTTRTDDWQKVTPSAANIDALAAGFDAEAGVSWSGV